MSIKDIVGRITQHAGYPAEENGMVVTGPTAASTLSPNQQRTMDTQFQFLADRLGALDALTQRLAVVERSVASLVAERIADGIRLSKLEGPVFGTRRCTKCGMAKGETGVCWSFDNANSLPEANDPHVFPED